MNTKSLLRLIPFLTVLFLLCFLSCFEEKESIKLSGHVIVASATEGPVLVIVSRSDDISNLNTDDIIAFEKTFEEDNSFSIDLTDSGVQVGENVALFAFVDSDYNGGIPLPSDGDAVGFFVDQDQDQYTVLSEIKSGSNSGINITVNRKAYTVESTIDFSIYNGFCPGFFNGVKLGTDYNIGDIIIVYAIQGESAIKKANSGDAYTFELDMNYVIGAAAIPITFSAISNGYSPNQDSEVEVFMGDTYTMQISPVLYGGIPVGNPYQIDDVTLIMFIDNGGTPGGIPNGILDPGKERVGYYGLMSELFNYRTVTVKEGVNVIMNDEFPSVALGFQPEVDFVDE
ncbi:MAG: hypothetical protein GY754_22940 [bacterium]|nr:hypothetical protein [bacterium]